MPEANDRPRQQQREPPASNNRTVDPSRVVGLYEAHGQELRRFVLGVTRDADLTNDVLQATFAKVVELGHTARAESFKGWLFRVAFHEALTARRRQESREQGRRRLAGFGFHSEERPEDRLIRVETIDDVRKALSQLPHDQQRVVLARMYEDKTFAEIASELKLPLGTVLTRMRLALDKLRRSLRAGD